MRQMKKSEPRFQTCFCDARETVGADLRVRPYQHRHCEDCELAKQDEATQTQPHNGLLGCFVLLRSPRNDGKVATASSRCRCYPTAGSRRYYSVFS